MTDEKPGFFVRLFFLSWVAWLRTLFDADFAAGVARLRRGLLPAETKPAEEKKEAPPPKPVVLKEPTPDAALQLLGILQREGRFVDFLEEDVSGFSDADVGAAARVVHDGCRKALHEHFDLEPIRAEEEGTKVTIPEGFDAAAIRLTGNVVGEPPFTGSLQHKGWRIVKVELPKLTEEHEVTVVTPAEVEL